MSPDLLLVTSWDVPCGIAEHSAMLVEALRACDPSFQIHIAHADAVPPSPEIVLARIKADNIRVVHLNYHAALHSQFHAGWIAAFQQVGAKVIITYHDTGVPNADLCKVLAGGADAFIIHEPAEDLSCRGPIHYWRMGVQDWQGSVVFDHAIYRHAPMENPHVYAGWSGGRPIVGTVGFPFPWKCYDTLVETAAAQDWAVLLLAPGATPAQIGKWREYTPHVCVVTNFTSRYAVVQLLGACDATAFTYVCHNTGQSGAILQGIAARKPVIALKTCRQFRALYEDPLGRASIRWAETFEEVAALLRMMPLQRVDPGIVALAKQEAWTHVAEKHLALYKGLV